jgi:hypothetical protein
MKMMTKSVSSLSSSRLLLTLLASTSTKKNTMNLKMVHLQLLPSKQLDVFGGISSSSNSSSSRRRALSIQMGTGKTDDFSGKEKIEEERFSKLVLIISITSYHIVSSCYRILNPSSPPPSSLFTLSAPSKLSSLLTSYCHLNPLPCILTPFSTFYPLSLFLDFLYSSYILLP